MNNKINYLALNQFLVISFFILFLTSTVLDAATHVIKFGGTLGNNYSPQELNVEVGDTVTWEGAFSSHPLSSLSIPQGAASFQNNSGTSFSYPVQVAGTYNYECDLHSGLGMTGSFSATVSSIESNGLSIQPGIFSLEQNYPNPFNPSTTIRYQLPVSGEVELSVYNLLGMKIATLVLEKQPAGFYQVQWDARENASGVYYYIIQVGEFQSVKMMVLLK
jgi:plastocyanin